MPNWKHLGRHFAWLLALGISMPGCTLLGASVGAGVDSLIPGPYEDRPRAQLVQLERDERVVVLLRNGQRVTGRYRGTHGPTAADLDRYLLVSTHENLVSVKGSEVSSIAVEVTGNGWLYGGLIGLAVDTAVIVAMAYTMNNMQLHLSNQKNDCFC